MQDVVFAMTAAFATGASGRLSIAKLSTTVLPFVALMLVARMIISLIPCLSLALSVCLTSQFITTGRAMPHLRASANRSIVNISSLAGRLGFRLRSPYAAAKWGVIGLTKSMAVELGPDRIRVNAVLPGLVAGDRQRRVLEARAQSRGIDFAQAEAEAFSFTSIRDYVTPRQIADQILFLASPRGRTVSGQAISVCGDTGMLG